MLANDFFDFIDVLGSGAVILGPDVTCDGFHQARNVRVQSHIHSDHMTDFSTSKSRQLVMTEPVKDLLSFDHPDFQFRPNVHTLSTGMEWRHGSSVISVEAAGHMLGACQTVVQLEDGRRLGYSGDFSWPLDNPIEVDALVVDATYGKPSSDRSYDQQSVDEALADLVRERIRLGPIQLAGNPGVIERALMIIHTSEAAAEVPILANSRLRARVDVHRKHGWSIGDILDVDQALGHEAVKQGQYIRCWHLSEGGRVEGLEEGTTISLTKYRAHSVVIKLAESNYRVGMSNHADFAGTLEYVSRTGAEYVVTDSHRGGDRARILANALEQELGITASPSSNTTHHKWESR